MAPSKEARISIERLYTLSTSHFPAVAQSVFNARGFVGAIPLDPEAFGGNAMGPKLTPVYEKTRGAVHDQLKATFDGLDETAGALQRIAAHWRGLEDALS